MYTYSRGVHPVKRLLHKFISIICASAYNYMIAITPEKNRTSNHTCMQFELRSHHYLISDHHSRINLRLHLNNYKVIFKFG